MELIIKNKIFLLVFICILHFNILKINAQLYTNKFDNDATLRPDSLFTNFEKPKLPDFFYKNYNSYENPNYSSKYSIYSFQFVCKFIVDDSCKVHYKSMLIYPIYNYGNNLPQKHKLWDSIISNIKLASKKWVVKRLYWDIGKANSKNLEEFYLKSNNDELPSSNRPSYGNQYHLMILTIYPDVVDAFSINRSERYNYIYRLEIE